MEFDIKKIEQVKEFMLAANSCVIVAHKSPDGDSVGSSLALFHFLMSMDINVVVCHPDVAPNTFDWMIGIDDIVTFQHEPDKVSSLIEAADLVFCLDFNALHRVGEEMSVVIQNSKGKRVVIDHHLHPTNEFDVVFSQPSVCSTAEMIFDFIQAIEPSYTFTEPVGEAIYCGIMTDSGSFRFPNVSAHTHEVLAHLILSGVNHTKIHEAVYDSNTINRLKLRGFAINDKMEVLDGLRTTIISLTADELNYYEHEKGDTDGLVNVGLSIVGVDKSIFLKESDGIIKISFRSKGESNPINVLASKHFNGGGHANAAGGRWEGSMESAIKRLKEVLPEFC